MTFRMKNIEWGAVSKYRGEMMGIAIIMIVLFHTQLPRTDAFFGLKRMGNIGVDIFLFLSGLGLWFSLTGQPSLKRFFKRRYLRIYPTWFIIACLYYLPIYFRGPHNIKGFIDLLGDIALNWDFWLHAELTFWYIPATMMLYLFAPAYIRLISKAPAYRWLPVAMVIWCVAVQWVTPIHSSVGHLEIFWSRIPIFFIGINCGEAVRQKTVIPGSSTRPVVIICTVTPVNLSVS